MATIVLSAVGQVVGGPIGSAVGALIGSQIDQMIFSPGGREGSRLKELEVTTSSYGTPVPRHYGKVRAAGSIIWATDLVESSEKEGGGKGRPSVTTFSYSTSFAVALASRPIKDIGRIWADGNLLRGAAGDLKTGGELRIYRGYGDQTADPLIASSEGANCPAFRGLAYCVFESLQLADFGNRIPSLSFEVIADDGEISLAQMVPVQQADQAIQRPLPQLAGFSNEGGPLASNLEAIGQIYPFTCDASGKMLTIKAADEMPSDPPMLPPPVIDSSGDSFGAASGQSRRRRADLRDIPEGLRYYDLSRDFQAGLQRADGRARPGRSRVIQFPGALQAEDARMLANKAADRAAWEKENLSWRIAELDPELAPGSIVRVPEKTGIWQVQSWELRETGVELDLRRVPHGPSRLTPADAGMSLSQQDIPATPTVLDAFELPWDGTGSSTQKQIFAAASSTGNGWTGAALFAAENGALSPVGNIGRKRATCGSLTSPLAPGQSFLFDRGGYCEVNLLSDDFALLNASMSGLANGANRALVGSEIIQFATAERIEGSQWRISGLLRGRGGTEACALKGHPSGAPFVLLDGRPLAIEPSTLGTATDLAATGLADSDPVVSPIRNAGSTLRPLQPVHPKINWQPDGAIELAWKRRSRGAWEWLDNVDAALNEQSERYQVGIGPVFQPVRIWETVEPCLHIGAAEASDIFAAHPGRDIWVRQIGSYGTSAPSLLLTI